MFLWQRRTINSIIFHVYLGRLLEILECNSERSVWSLIWLGLMQLTWFSWLLKGVRYSPVWMDFWYSRVQDFVLSLATFFLWCDTRGQRRSGWRIGKWIWYPRCIQTTAPRLLGGGGPWGWRSWLHRFSWLTRGGQQWSQQAEANRDTARSEERRVTVIM